MDRMTKNQRSKNMAAIKSRNTRPEIFIRQLLFSNGYRYRLYDKKILGKPDIVLKKYNTVIFVHGCFWHRHRNCPKATIPEGNHEFWLTKLTNNEIRDKKINEDLIRTGYKVLIIWQCACVHRHADELLNKISTFLHSTDRYLEIGRSDLVVKQEKDTK